MVADETVVGGVLESRIASSVASITSGPAMLRRVSGFFEDVLVLLRDCGVRFVIVGGTAVILHGVPRTTADLDLVVDMEPSNVRIDAGGLVLRIAGIEDLIRMKKAAARDQDLADADALQRLLDDRGDA